MLIDMFPRTIENWLKIGRNVPILRHQSARIEPCGVYSVATKNEVVKILHFKQFYKHIVFTSEVYKI